MPEKRGCVGALYIEDALRRSIAAPPSLCGPQTRLHSLKWPCAVASYLDSWKAMWGAIFFDPVEGEFGLILASFLVMLASLLVLRPQFVQRAKNDPQKVPSLKLGRVPGGPFGCQNAAQKGSGKRRQKKGAPQPAAVGSARGSESAQRRQGSQTGREKGSRRGSKSRFW